MVFRPERGAFVGGWMEGEKLTARRGMGGPWSDASAPWSWNSSRGTSRDKKTWRQVKRVRFVLFDEGALKVFGDVVGDILDSQ